MMKRNVEGQEERVWRKMTMRSWMEKEWEQGIRRISRGSADEEEE